MKMHHEDMELLTQSQESHNDDTTMSTSTEEAQQQKEENKLLDKQDCNNNKQQSNDTKAADETEHTMAGSTEVPPKEWQWHHNAWLNVVMWEAIGNQTHLMIQDLHMLIPVYHPAPNNDINIALVKDYITRYNLCIKVAAGENQVELFHQVFCKWYLKLREADPQALL